MWQSQIFISQNTSVAAPPISDVCVIYCIGENCSTTECRPVSGAFRIDNITSGVNYNISVSLRNDFGESGQTTALYGECIGNKANERAQVAIIFGWIVDVYIRIPGHIVLL